MSLKQAIENSPFAYLATVAVTAFVAGWGAHAVVQSAAGLVAISSDKAKRAERYAQEREELLARIADKGLERDASAQEPSTARARAASAAVAQPATSSYSGGSAPDNMTGSKHSVQQASEPAVTVGTTYLEPGIEQGMTTNEKLTVEFDYIVRPGRAVLIHLVPQGDIVGYIDTRSGPVTGSGRLSRTIQIPQPGRITALEIWTQQGEDEPVRAKRIVIEIPVRKPTK